MKGEGKHARRRNQNHGAFHALNTPEIYTTEYRQGSPRNKKQARSRNLFAMVKINSALIQVGSEIRPRQVIVKAA